MVVVGDKETLHTEVCCSAVQCCSVKVEFALLHYGRIPTQYYAYCVEKGSRVMCFKTFSVLTCLLK